MKRLAVFDFDHTIIEDNSDVVVMNMLDPQIIKPEVRELRRSDNWTSYMQEIFKLLNDKCIKEDQIKTVIKNLPEVRGMGHLIKELNNNLNHDVIIISDSNTYFINTWLEVQDLKKHVYKVFSNPAYFDEDGLLNIHMFHYQDTCKLSSKNLCKGQIMEEFIKHQEQNNIVYSEIMYCGDGANDFCPILRLKETDLACVRINYKCAELVAQSKDGVYTDDTGEPIIVKCSVCIWCDAFNILEYIVN